MFTSISHEMRAPIAAMQDALTFVKPVLQEAD
jgi:signal transduction histidine kinase